jgi:PKD repeat protein
VQLNGGTPTTTTYNTANQITNAGFSYDNAGNMISDGAAYTYDALSRTIARGGTTYAYNGDGTLVSQATGGVTTRYTQDLAAPLTQVLQTQVGAATRTGYIYGLNRLASLTGSTKTWYVADALGSVRRTVTDSGTPLALLHGFWSLSAVASATPSSRSAPLAVSFSAAGSSDPDGDPLTYDWDFGDASAHSSATAPAHSYAAGVYIATLRLSDNYGNSDTAMVRIDMIALIACSHTFLCFVFRSQSEKRSTEF